MADDLLDHDPSATLVDEPSETANPALPWLLHDAKCTLSHPALGPRPKWGYLQFDESSTNADNAWSFICGKNKTGTTVQLPNFREKAHEGVYERQYSLLLESFLRLSTALGLCSR